MADASTMFTGTDGIINVTGVVSEPSGTAITGAVVTGTLKDSTGTIVSGWSAVSMADQGGGTYSYAFPASAVPAIGTYTLTVVVAKSGLTQTVYHDVLVANDQI